MSVKDTPRNLYLHEVLDVWFEHEVKPRLRGRAFEVRYAEDAVRVFEHEEDARRVRAVLARRMEKYGLRLHPDKTRRVDARRPDKRPRGGTRRGRSFTTLGFTHYWGRSGKGRWVVKRKTAKACPRLTACRGRLRVLESGDRLSRSLKAAGQWCRAHRHWMCETSTRR